MDDIVDTHKITRQLLETVIIPEHKERKESKEFRQSKKRLKKDGHYKCWVCGTEENIEVHHLGCEWSLGNVCDFDKLKLFCEEWDIYGYGKLLKNKSIESPDDIRNLMVLCNEHHQGNSKDGVANGIHNITFPIWIIQKLCFEEENPVPQDGEDIEKVIQEIDKIEGEENAY